MNLIYCPPYTVYICFLLFKYNFIRCQCCAGLNFLRITTSFSYPSAHKLLSLHHMKLFIFLKLPGCQQCPTGWCHLEIWLLSSPLSCCLVPSTVPKYRHSSNVTALSCHVTCCHFEAHYTDACLMFMFHHASDPALVFLSTSAAAE